MNSDTAYLAMRWLAATIVLTTIGTALSTDQVLGSNEEWSDVSGMVTDVSGAIVVQAEVLFNCGGAIVKTSTNQKGFSAKLHSGNCSVSVQASGLETKTITDLQIHAPQPAILNIVLQVGSTRIVDGVFPQEIEPIPAELPFLLVEEVQTDTEMGSICVLPNLPEPPTRISPGGEYNPDTLTVRLDKRQPIYWPHKKPVLIDNLDIQHEHFVVLTSDGKRIQSFRFKFSDYHDARLCVYFDGYQGVQLGNRKDALWCKVKNRNCWR